MIAWETARACELTKPYGLTPAPLFMPSYDLHMAYLIEKLRATNYPAASLSEPLLRAQLEEIQNLSGDLLLPDSQFEKASERERMKLLG